MSVYQQFWSQGLLCGACHFYHTTVCLRAVLAVGRCLSVCSSVRPSDRLVYCIKTAEDIIKHFRPDSHIILVFDPICITCFREKPSHKQNTGVGKIHNFRPTSGCILERVKENQWLLYGMLIGCRRSRSIRVISDDPE